MMGVFKGHFSTMEAQYVRGLLEAGEVVSMAMWVLGTLCSTREFVGLCTATA